MDGKAQCVLFDLDGTLVDTAPDLAGALNRTLGRHDREPLPVAAIRPSASLGGAALVKLGFQLDEADPSFKPLLGEFLATYRADLACHSHLFPGMEQVLERLQRDQVCWGVVTNKPAWLTLPLMQALQLHRRAACIVSGDTLAQRKPHPAPLLHACRLVRRAPQETVYVGDDRRDVQAGRSAGTATLVAGYGYIGANEDPHTWGADGCIDQPEDVLAWINAGG